MALLNGLSLFSGIGGIDLAIQEWVNPIAYCEIEPYCQSVLLQRMQEGNLPKAPIWDDIRTLSRDVLYDSGLIYYPIDIIYGGFPCQNISIAGRQEGLEGERSGLFFEILRIIDEIKTPFIFLENVPNIRTKGAERVCKELAERGYDCRWCMLSAADVGARHKRERWFLLGYSKHNGLDAPKEQGSIRQAICNNKERKNETSESKRADTSRMLAHSHGKRNTRLSIEKEATHTKSGISCKDATDSSGERLEGQCESERIQPKYPYISDSCWGKLKSPVCGIADDVSITLDTVAKTTTETKNRTSRIKALGNSVVPLQVKTAFEILMNIENN